MRTRLRACIPPQLRLRVRCLRRWLVDWRDGSLPLLATSAARQTHWPSQLTLQQPILPGVSVAAKLHNLRLAAASLNDREIPPGGILSLMRMLGEPSAKRGYRTSRMLVGGDLVQGEGGGLCQLSGLLYLLALHAGLGIVERHAHSCDIYTEDTRFCPLGSDATLVYGYKDLRLRNTLPFSVAFRVETADDALSASLCAPQPVAQRRVEFLRRDESPDTRTVCTRVDGHEVWSDRYRILLPAP
ncbi:MAG: VanW family protein [Betaproteobacteria bacterium]|nr:VanW family protein [Betaproteobacteria bacterium]